jgi:GNAT superfamily N-acetyltransferase
MTKVKIRNFVSSDLAACVAISNAIDPEHAIELSEAQQDDTAWNAERYHRSRYVAEQEGDAIVAWGEIAHAPWQFHPHQYELRLAVDPGHRRRGVGGLLLERFLTELRERGAVHVRAIVFEDDLGSIGFLLHWGFREVWRELESRLELASFDPAPFAGAADRVARQGIKITSLPDELAQNQSVLGELYDLYDISNQGQLQLYPVSMPSFDEFVANVVNDPRTIPESWFLAREGGRLVGLSTLEHPKGSSDVLEAGYTAVHPDHRGRGIAIALKLRTIDFAREQGYAYIHTSSNAVNEPMLRINAALGFKSLPAQITYVLSLGAGEITRR